MLARVANNLFWMGRYLERTEHIARFLNVNYFSSFDAPNETSQSRQFALKSIVRMVDDDPETDTILFEKKVLFDAALNDEKIFSIKSYFRMARDNASGVRDVISSELYESINKLHHYIKNYSIEYFTERGLDEFTTYVAKSIAEIKSIIITTMMHNEVYCITKLGINLERATDVIRIIDTKYKDALTVQNESDFSTSYEWTTLLKCIQSFDMMKRYYKKAPTNKNTLDFLILNPECPKSVMTCLNNSKYYIDYLNKPGSLKSAFLIGKLTAKYQYKKIDEIEESFHESIQELISELDEICIQIEDELLKF